MKVLVEHQRGGEQPYQDLHQEKMVIEKFDSWLATMTKIAVFSRGAVISYHKKCENKLIRSRMVKKYIIPGLKDYHALKLTNLGRRDILKRKTLSP